ncbi:uncharacterized protein SCHCODRAFT_02610667 [Schizophyllum commune H4-8]|uniref:uncharacterized protein n=1 Tax=Schizophyllum commune (strain H4-8 / FGSC 9210) TaxID=578458 RepID=UPI00215E7D53|nr:uncharacterized protein SCHCODRAFT_02610667 [Schizophyllum commune H4-8]KAI5897937.1 hypothetical protein SCHCODRAFT_02610667 [Schizophyllum commune H4-8]
MPSNRKCCLPTRHRRGGLSVRVINTTYLMASINVIASSGLSSRRIDPRSPTY